jgi:hypothetical protein
MGFVRTRACTSGTRLWVISSAAVSLIVVAPLAAHASVSSLQDDTARVNGTVLSIAQVGHQDDHRR